MSDEKLIAEVARIWVDAGADEEGLMWNVQRIRDAIAAEIAARKEDECAAAIRAMKEQA